MLDIERFRKVHQVARLTMFVVGFLLAYVTVHYGYQNKLSLYRVTENILITSLIGVVLAEVGNQTYRRLFKGGVPDNLTRNIISPYAYETASHKLLMSYAEGLGTLLLFAVIWRAVTVIF